MQSFISKAKPGDLFYIEEIKVKGQMVCLVKFRELLSKSINKNFLVI